MKKEENVYVENAGTGEDACVLQLQQPDEHHHP